MFRIAWNVSCSAQFFFVPPNPHQTVMRSTRFVIALLKNLAALRKNFAVCCAGAAKVPAEDSDHDKVFALIA
ncbi:hypothetical protein DWB58_25620 [candidate division KSB1 bacterium]|nr:hypothetical protein [candidate division KSB1 bacterium]